jgi:uncharacterized protein (TIGR00255 family)
MSAAQDRPKAGNDTEASVLSMTGYAQVQRPAAGGTVTVTLKAVNHRFLDLRWQVPEEWEGLTAALEPRLRQRLRRGHVDIRLSGERDPSTAALAPLDWEAAAGYVAAYREVAERFGLPNTPSAADVLRLASQPAARNGWAEVPEAAITAAFEAALEALIQMRRDEGRRLADDVLSRCRHIEQAAAAIVGERAQLEAALLERLRRRLLDLLGEHAPSPERLLQEAALVAERSDISEELTRLNAHVAQVRAILTAGAEVGKRLDFLTPELNREANTLLSKTSAGGEAGLRITNHGLELKAEIEKMREQVQNLE